MKDRGTYMVCLFLLEAGQLALWASVSVYIRYYLELFDKCGSYNLDFLQSADIAHNFGTSCLVEIFDTLRDDGKMG